MDLEQFYCRESGLEIADEYFHLLKSQTEHKGNCTKENYPCLKCEFEDLIHKFLVYKFGEVGINLNDYPHIVPQFPKPHHPTQPNFSTI